MRTALWVATTLAFIPLATQAEPTPDGDANDAGGSEALSAQVVYRSDFADGAERWSTATVSAAPDGTRYLGPFGNQKVRLELDDLPDHRYVRLRLVVCIFDSWDGSWNAKQMGLGPDILEVSVAGGQRLIRATFRNSKIGDSARGQSFPDDYGGPTNPALLGAVPGETMGHRSCSVYRLDLPFPHDDETLTIKVIGSNLQEISDESWGIASARVELLPAPPNAELAEAKIAEQVRRLGSADQLEAFEATWTLVGVGEPAIPFLLGRWDGDAAKLARPAKRWVAALEDADWRVRERASAELLALGPQATPLLRDAMADANSPEVRGRLASVLRIHARGAQSQEKLKLRRVIKVLEMLHTPAARKAMVQLGTEHPTIRNLANSARIRMEEPEQ